MPRDPVSGKRKRDPWVWYVFPAFYLIFVIFIFANQRSLMYMPSAAADGPAGFAAEQVRTEDGLTLTGYAVPPGPGKPVMVLFHGNASLPKWEAFKTGLLRQKGYGIVLAGYRGYGGNPGSPSEKGFYADGEAYLDWVSKEYPGHPLILYGESIGTGVAVEMAKRHSPAALILEVPFKSALSVARRAYWFVPLKFLLMQDQYRSDLKIGDVHAPVLFLLAEDDKVVTLTSGQALYDLANQPKKKIVFPHVGHSNVYDAKAEPAVVEFLEGVFGP